MRCRLIGELHEISNPLQAHLSYKRASKTSLGAGSSRDRTILSPHRVCDCRPQSFIMHWRGNGEFDSGRFRGSECRARFAAARVRLSGYGLFRVLDRKALGFLLLRC